MYSAQVHKALLGLQMEGDPRVHSWDPPTSPFSLNYRQHHVRQIHACICTDLHPAQVPKALLGLQVEGEPRMHTWDPPASPFSLIEEVLYNDPWRLLLACMLLNKTSGRAVSTLLRCAACN